MSKFPVLAVLCYFLALGSLATDRLYGADLLVPSQFATIQTAIEAAEPLDQILVEPGIYVENINFLGLDITVTAIEGPELTVIDGTAMTRGPDEGSTVVISSGESPLAILQGFTIRGGSGKVITDSTGTFSRGGGILISGSSPSLINCLVKDNQAQMGAGLHASESPAMSVLDLTFRNNSGLEGAGAYFQNIDTVVLNQCTFQMNSAQTAGGALTFDSISMAQVESGIFLDNGALIGGALDSKLSVVQLNNCEFSGNDATLIGGAIAFYQSSATVSDSTIRNNVSGHGAGIGIDGGSVDIFRCVLADNFATSHGGGIAATLNQTSVNLSHVTLANNQAIQGSSGVYFPQPSPGAANSTLLASHSILWNPGGLELVLPTLASTDFCDVEGGYSGVANLDADPLFSDPMTGDYSLTQSSPCIDSGSSTAIPDPDGTLPDIGAIWHDQRPDPATDLVCALTDPCTNTYTLTWGLETPADAVVISLGDDPGNLVPITSLPGDATSFSWILNTPGTPTVCVEPIANGMSPEEGPSCCLLTVSAIPGPVPISGFTCVVDDDDCATFLNWTNGQQYSSLQLLLNGVEHSLLDGENTSAIVFIIPNTLTTITLVATTPCGAVLPPVSCEGYCDVPVELFMRGDSNADGNLTLPDVLFSLDAIFGLAVSPCPDAQDTNDDGVLDISDPLMLLLYLFGNLPAPPAPGVTCGEDPVATEEDLLDCPGSPGCP
ncbi:MAG: right-handed parallel beta-helix repeat-containing protein [Planctomycetota bacterium]